MSAPSCDRCGANPARVQYTEIREGHAEQLQICEECARALGFDSAPPPELPVPEPSPPGKVFGVLSVTDVTLEGGRPRDERVCPNCGLTGNELRSEPLFGCPDCYEAFRDSLPDLFLRLHEATGHLGRTPHGAAEEGREGGPPESSAGPGGEGAPADEAAVRPPAPNRPTPDPLAPTPDPLAPTPDPLAPTPDPLAPEGPSAGARAPGRRSPPGMSGRPRARGARPPRGPAADRADLQERLREAIEKQDYEAAARIRDALGRQKDRSRGGEEGPGTEPQGPGGPAGPGEPPRRPAGPEGGLK